jgi:hypothetical protein
MKRLKEGTNARLTWQKLARTNFKAILQELAFSSTKVYQYIHSDKVGCFKRQYVHLRICGQFFLAE